MRLTFIAARAIAAPVLAFALAPAAAAQSTPGPQPPPGAPASGPVRQLTLNEAVAQALEQNLSIQVERINPRLEDENVAMARSAFLPTLETNLAYNNADSPPDSFLSGAGDILKSDFFQTTAGIRQQMPWGGGSYTVGWDGTRSTSNSAFNNFNPRLRSNLALSLTQPLVRNFSVDASRTRLLISRRNREISEVDLRSTVVQTVRAVKNAYWDLKYAINNLQVQQQGLDLARQTLKDNRTRVEVGTMAPIDIVEAEAEVARNEEAVIVAETAIKQAEDQLRALIADPSSPDFWQTTLEPVDSPQMDAVEIDIDGAVSAALDRRTDLRRARQSLENVADNLRYYRNQTLPQVNLLVDYTATGLGGTNFERGQGFPPPIIEGSEVTRGLGSVLGDVFSSSFPTWQIGVAVSYPLGRSNAEASYARTRLEQGQALVQVKNIELQVATQVRNLGRQVNSNTKRIEATRAARVLSERRLEAEQKKFGVGMSTSFLVFQAQRDLATARSNELRAILDYNKSLADFEAIQEAAISGGSITVGGSSGTSAGSVSSGGSSQGGGSR